MKNYFFFFFLFFFSLLLTTTVFAIGISPPKITQEFVGEQSFTYTVNIINNAQPSYFEASALGSPLAEFVTFSKTQGPLPGGLTPLSFTLRLPAYDDLAVDSFGQQIIRLRISEVPPPNRGGFTAVTSVEGWLIVNVPVPGEFAEIKSFVVPTVNESQSTSARLILRNRGTLSLADKSATITITDAAGDVVEQTAISGIDLAVDQEKTLYEPLATSTYLPGKYFADATFYFNDDLEPVVRSNTFFVGDTDIQVTDYTRVLEEGKINKVRFQLQSLWGTPLRSVRGNIVNFGGRPEALPVIDLGPFQQTWVETYISVPYLNASPFNLNTSVVRNTTFETTFTLEFPVDAASDTFKEIPITFTVLAQDIPEEPKKTLSTTTILIISLGVLILLLLVAVILLMSRNGKKTTKN